MKTSEPNGGPSNTSFSGYHRRDIPAEDAEITHTGPGTPLGEYMRRFWQPVCMSEQLTDVPHAIRILSEDLVAFRDKSDRVGVLHRHCSHRGASLEFGVIANRGIRCCYHGFHYDVDGTLLAVAADPSACERLKKTISQGAYPAFERDGLVFAYMGPPEKKPTFPEYDGFHAYADIQLVPFANVYPCNWMQVFDNHPDHMHTYILHNNMVADGTDPTASSLPEAFMAMPEMEFVEIRERTSAAIIAGRRVGENIWVRITEAVLPNISLHASLYEDGEKRKIFTRLHMSRWYVPVDNTNTIIYGWRMFSDSVEPSLTGDPDKVGWEKMDFLDGQTGDRPYEVAQRAPGDWEALVSQRPIAVHALENPIASDKGVYMFRRMLRAAIRGEIPAANPDALHTRANAGEENLSYTNTSILKVAKRADEEADRELIREVGRKILEIAQEADVLSGAEREATIKKRIEELEKTA